MFKLEMKCFIPKWAVQILCESETVEWKPIVHKGERAIWVIGFCLFLTDVEPRILFSAFQKCLFVK